CGQAHRMGVPDAGRAGPARQGPGGGVAGPGSGGGPFLPGGETRVAARVPLRSGTVRASDQRRQADGGGSEESRSGRADGGAALAAVAQATAPRQQSGRVLQEPERLPEGRGKQGAGGTVVAGNQRRDRVVVRQVQVVLGEVS